MHIGATLYLTAYDPHSNRPVQFRSKIIEKTVDHIYIDYPINMESDKTSILPIGTKLTAAYLNGDEQLYQFQTIIHDKVQLTMPSLVLKHPEKEAIDIVQRREHVRVRAAVDIAVHCPENTFSPFTTITVDISGGGLSMITPKNVTLRPKQEIIVWLVLPMNSGALKYFDLESEVVRTKSDETDILTSSIRFVAPSHKAEEQIIKFCFEKQIEERKHLWV